MILVEKLYSRRSGPGKKRSMAILRHSSREWVAAWIGAVRLSLWTTYELLL